MLAVMPIKSGLRSYGGLHYTTFIAIFAAMSIQMTFITALVIITATTLLIAIALKIPYVKMMTNPSLFFEKKL